MTSRVRTWVKASSRPPVPGTSVSRSASIASASGAAVVWMPVTSRSAATLNRWPRTAAPATSSLVCREQDASRAAMV